MYRGTAVALASALALGALASNPASAEMTVNLEPVAEGLTAPLIMVSPPNDDRRFVVEQIGTIRILTPEGELLDQPFLDIRHKIPDLLSTFDEKGLLGLAFHPDFANNGKFYVAYSGIMNAGGDPGKQLWWSHTNNVAEYQVSPDDPNSADPRSEKIITAIDWPQFNHNGHWIGFGPDGYLYISTGDGGYANDWGIGHNVEIGNGQDLTSLHGKILRIDVDNPENGLNYGIPDDNPFADRFDALPEIYAYGLRNPWRCSFDMGGDNQLFCADVGQNSYEEISIIEAGGNYGWRAMEGTHCFDYVNPNQHPETCENEGMIEPIIEYNNCNVFPQDCNGLSVTGGYVYRGDAVPELAGAYFFGDYCSGEIFALQGGGPAVLLRTDLAIASFGEDEAGELYVVDYGGAIHRVVEAGRF